MKYKSIDLFVIGSCNFSFSLRWYKGPHTFFSRHVVGYRTGQGRFALDVYGFSLVFEKYPGLGVY